MCRLLNLVDFEERAQILNVFGFQNFLNELPDCIDETHFTSCQFEGTFPGILISTASDIIFCGLVGHEASSQLRVPDRKLGEREVKEREHLVDSI